MSTDLFLFSLFYLLLSVGIIYPPIEFVSAGLTIPAIFANFLGSENEHFVNYHLKRSSLTLFVHSMIPFCYVFVLLIFFDENVQISFLWNNESLYLLQLISTTAFVCPLLALYKIYVWSNNNWQKHPICKNLTMFCNPNTTWLLVAADINIEFRRVDKMAIQTNSIIKVIATDNWILKITPYNIYTALQSDSALIVSSSDTHYISPYNRGEVQYINIEVKSTRPNVLPFIIRLNALDFKDLQDKYSRPITILPNVTFHKTLLERFIDAFREQISLNAKYSTEQELELCIGCMQVLSNVKIQKLCIEESNEVQQPGENCVACYCRPMWCVECMARWFASRQDDTSPDTWLACKCTCPVCRAKFCIYDVSMISSL